MAAPPVGVALVGLGRAGNLHLTTMRTIPGECKLLWAVDMNEKLAREVAEAHGCKWATTLDEAVADAKVDAVIIASTTDTHFPFVMQSLKGGKATFTEKPISADVKDVEAAVALSESKGVPFFCAYQRRCDKNFRELKRQLDAGAIGTLKLIKSCSRDNPVPPLPYLRTSGGIFRDMLIHDFDMHDWLSGGQAPESVTAVGHAYDDAIKEMEDIDTAAVLCKYASGLITMIDTCRSCAFGYDQRIEAFGGDGMLTAQNELNHTVQLATVSGHQTPQANWSFPERYREAYGNEMAEFISIVKAKPGSDVREEAKTAAKRHPRILRTCMAADLSWRLGRQVSLSEDLEALCKKAEEERATKRRKC